MWAIKYCQIATVIYLACECKANVNDTNKVCVSWMLAIERASIMGRIHTYMCVRVERCVAGCVRFVLIPLKS